MQLSRKTSVSFLTVVQSFCLFFLNLVQTENVQPKSDRKYVVVFDVDATLCSVADSKEKLKYAKEHHPESPIIDWDCKSFNFHHVFIPYLQVLFDYLLEKGVRIVFFSSAVKERDLLVIPNLLVTFYGREKYEALKSEGQFAIFSREFLRLRNKTTDEEGVYIKDLSLVIRDGESLSNTVLVEENPSFTAVGQEPCLEVFDLTGWFYNLEERRKYDHPKNSVYYMIGVFKTYFENSKYQKLSFREGLKEMNLPAYPKDKEPVVARMIDLGLSEVKSRLKRMKGNQTA